MRRFAVLIAAGLAAVPASAGELREFQAGSIDLGRLHGVIYYSITRDGYRVVTTMGSEETQPVRFVATLADGQTLGISVPGVPGEPGEVVEISRIGGKLVLADGAAGTGDG